MRNVSIGSRADGTPSALLMGLCPCAKETGSDTSDGVDGTGRIARNLYRRHSMFSRVPQGNVGMAAEQSIFLCQK
jgi:hypothetical protein